MKNVLVSACLLGLPCRYDGKSVRLPEIEALSQACHIVPFCPEIYGGLPTPRESAEIRAGGVYTKSGADVTRAFEKGALLAVQLAEELHCEFALLKDNSPSCGAGAVYNGSFSGVLAPGYGLAARALMDAGIMVYAASRARALLEALARFPE